MFNHLCMILETTIHKNGNSTMIRMDPSFTKYYNLHHGEKCKIEDLNEHEMKVIFG